LLPALVSLSLTEEQAMIVAELVEAFVAPNSFYSEELTQQAIDDARQAIAPVTRSFKTGETIIQRGQVIDATDIEALQILGLVQPQYSWRDFASAATLAFLIVGMVGLYLKRQRELIRDSRAMAMLVFLFLLWLLVARWVIPGHVLLPYVFPIAAFGMIVSVLISTEVGLICTTALAILVVFEMPQSVELASYYILSSYFGILFLGRAHRVTSFFVAGLAVAVSGAAAAIAFRLVDPSVDLIGLTSISGMAVMNGFASTGLTIMFQYFLAQLLGLTTALQLMELSRPDHPLLQMLLRNAPGTYQHSLQVANLAEQAAERIGADTLLTRVGALYHDIGKAANPPYFIENQGAGNVNPHDNLDPETSAQTIIQHVLDGLELARKYRMPRRIQNFVLEHHGDMITRYQYARAVKEAGGDEDQVDLKTYIYPGPIPASKETAILMLADGCEARVRAEQPKNEEELAEIIKSVIKHRLSDGQLDNTNLTMSELSELADSFTSTLRGIYHPRIEYPKLETRQEKSVDSTPTLPSGNRILVEPPNYEGENMAGEENGDASVDSSEV
jgi:putative nucleotidyltransferase with HDIG domain